MMAFFGFLFVSRGSHVFNSATIGGAFLGAFIGLLLALMFKRTSQPRYVFWPVRSKEGIIAECAKLNMMQS
jgi:hypothetical protein